MKELKWTSLLLAIGSLGFAQGALAQPEYPFGPDPWYVLNDQVEKTEPSEIAKPKKPFGRDPWYVLGDVEKERDGGGMRTDPPTTRQILDEAFNRHYPTA